MIDLVMTIKMNTGSSKSELSSRGSKVFSSIPILAMKMGGNVRKEALEMDFLWAGGGMSGDLHPHKKSIWSPATRY